MSAPHALTRAEALHARIVEVHAAYRRSERDLAVLLASLAEGRLYQALGYASLGEYGEQVLHLRPRKVEDLATLGRRLGGLPAVDRAFAAGELSWSKAREIARVATPETEAAWVERAARTTNRELEALVSSAGLGDAPDEVRKGPSRVRLVFEMDAVEAEQVHLVLAALRVATGVAREEVGEGALLAQVAQRVLHDLETEHAPTAERYRIVLEQCPHCRHTSGIDNESNDTHVGAAVCDGEAMEMRPGPERGHVGKVIPPATRRAVLHRDRYRCRVPGCTNWLWFDLHHLRERHRGGGHEEENLLTLCCTHHTMAHDGLLGIEGRGGGDLLFRFPGGRILSASARQSPLDCAADESARRAVQPAEGGPGARAMDELGGCRNVRQAPGATH